MYNTITTSQFLPTFTTRHSSSWHIPEMALLKRQILRKQQLAAFTAKPSIAARRCFSSSPVSREAQASKSASAVPTAKPHTIDPRWLTSMKTRIGKCLMFGLKTPQVQETGGVLRQLAGDWRELVAGSEGYLTGEMFRGLFRHNVVWGEMVCVTIPVSQHGEIDQFANV